MRTVLKPVATTTKSTYSSHLQLPTYVCVCESSRERESRRTRETESACLCAAHAHCISYQHTHVYIHAQLHDPLFSLLTCFFCLQLQKHIVTALCFHCEFQCCVYVFVSTRWLRLCARAESLCRRESAESDERESRRVRRAFKMSSLLSHSLLSRSCCCCCLSTSGVAV